MALAQYKSPGVYVQEVPSSIQGIAGVSTSTAGFIGIFADTVNLVAPNPTGGTASPSKLVEFTIPTPAKTVVPITNWTQFVNAFGDLIGAQDGSAATDPTAGPDQAHRNLAQAVYGFFANGGSLCFVVRVATAADVDAALDALDAIDEVALVCAPGVIDDVVRGKIIDRCEALQDRFAILDGPATVADFTKLPTTGTGGFAPRNTNYGAWYYPWLKVFDPAEKLLHPDGDGTVPAPPSGHVAGIFARVDNERGVFKSPGNEIVRAALAVTHPLSRPQQDSLNPAGVNLIRTLNGNLLVWGARTVGGDANSDLKYISTRRSLSFLRKSIEQGLHWAVFEPNTPDLWSQISRSVTGFLTTFWRAGGLFGATAQDAFFVKCDAENNPPEQREAGNVFADVGVAIVRPAEFVIFRISQSAPTK